MTSAEGLDSEFVLKWRLGVRTACLIANTAARFQSRVAIHHEGLTFDAKEALGVMLPAGARLRVSAAGPDAAAAMSALRELFTCGDAVLECPHANCRSAPVLTGFTAEEISYSCSNFHSWSVTRGNAVPAEASAVLTA